MYFSSVTLPSDTCYATGDKSGSTTEKKNKTQTRTGKMDRAQSLQYS